jgi:hypothetical protein
MTQQNFATLMEAIMDLRSEIREDMREMADRLAKIDERLRDVEVAQAIARGVNIEADLSGKWKAGIATSIAAALAALLQALTQKGN